MSSRWLNPEIHMMKRVLDKRKNCKWAYVDNKPLDCRACRDFHSEFFTCTGTFLGSVLHYLARVNTRYAGFKRSQYKHFISHHFWVIWGRSDDRKGTGEQMMAGKVRGSRLGLNHEQSAGVSQVSRCLPPAERHLEGKVVRGERRGEEEGEGVTCWHLNVTASLRDCWTSPSPP